MQMRLETIIGSMGEVDIADRLHHLSHHGKIETLTLKHEDLARHRLTARTDAGREVAVVLPRQLKLYDGAVLHLGDEYAIVVRAGEQKWLRLRTGDLATALELGYHAGNLHWRVRFDHGDLLVACDGPEENYLSRLDTFLANGRADIVEEGQERDGHEI